MSDRSDARRPTLVYRFYTGARRIPLMVGRTPTGEKLWGGPYRITQAVVAGVALFVLYLTNQIGLWGGENILSDLVVGAVIVLGLGFISGKLPITKRSAWSMGRSALHAFNAPAMGTYQGRELRIRKPRLRYRTHGFSRHDHITLPVLPEVAPVAAVVVPKPAVAPSNPAPVPSAAPPRAATAVEALLAQIK